MKTFNKAFRQLPLIAGLLLANFSVAQTTILYEGMGTVPSTTLIPAHETANGFDNDPLTMSGTADVRNTSPSAVSVANPLPVSGLANIFFTNTVGKSFEISGINTTGYVSLQLSFAILKSTTASTGADFIVEVSSNGSTYTPLSFGPLPTGTGTAVWRRVTATGTIPSTSTLYIRFRQNGTATQYRVDDILLTGSGCAASITADGPLTFCEGEDVMLTANSSASYLWSTGETTQSITVSTTGSYSVVTSVTGGCTASATANVQVNTAPGFGVVASPDTICLGDTVQFTARLYADNLIISEYVEGSGNNKYVEIFNGTGAPVDLGRYHYRAYHNGVSTPTRDFAFSDVVPAGNLMLADGDVIVLKNRAATIYNGVAYATDSVQHNGDDAIEIVDTTTGIVADIFGVIGEDPGSQWNAVGGYGTADHTERRNDYIVAGVSVNPAIAGPFGFTTLGTEWTQYPVDDTTGLGFHSFTCNYSWSPSTTPSTGCTVDAVPSASGFQVYTVTATYANGCTSTNTVFVIVNECEGERKNMINTVDANNLSVYPNPFSGSTTINIHLAADNVVSMEIMDINGKIVNNMYNGKMEAGDYRLNWEANDASGARLAPGMYICRVMIGNEVKTTRVVVQ